MSESLFRSQKTRDSLQTKLTSIVFFGTFLYVFCKLKKNQAIPYFIMSNVSESRRSLVFFGRIAHLFIICYQFWILNKFSKIFWKINKWFLNFLENGMLERKKNLFDSAVLACGPAQSLTPRSVSQFRIYKNLFFWLCAVLACGE